MASAWIIEAVDVFEDGHLGLPQRFPYSPPYQLGLDGFEEGLDGCVIIAISFAAHRDLEAMLPQDLLIVVRTVLAAPIRVHYVRLSISGDGSLQRLNAKAEQSYPKIADAQGSRSATLKQVFFLADCSW